MSEEDFLQEPLPPESKSIKNSINNIRQSVSRAGLNETVLRLGTHAFLLALILVVAWGMRELYVRSQVVNPPESAVMAASVPTITPTEPPPKIPFLESDTAFSSGIPRLAHLHTDVPSRPRLDVFQYTVKEGDTLFGLSDKFGIEPETILWGNQPVLGDNPHNLRPGQELNILPIDGAYHKWSAGDGLNGVAKFFNVEPEKIVNFSGNNLSPSELGDWSNPNIEPGTWLVIPDGEREYVSWSAPVIPLDDPSVAKVLGPGACETVSVGAVGSGTFIWPANNHWLSGFDFSPRANHNGIDVDGEEGDPVYAVDNGVVVYAGWNNWGYGNVVVINHGNGWQTLYGHLNAIYVNCSQSVWQTNIIGAIGNTGNSSGSHLHFELMYNGAKVNPHDYLR